MTLPTRSKKYGIGKWIGGRVYVHRSAINVLPKNLVTMAKRKLPKISRRRRFTFDVVSFHEPTGRFVFTKCKDFDGEPEPTITAQCSVELFTGRVAVRSISDTNPDIYHHKWLMVRDSYKGFDVEASKRRSKAWLELGYPGRLIGKRLYWDHIVVPFIPT